MTTTMMIEASSPLASMQPSLLMNPCGFGQDSLTYASFARGGFVPESFNFKEMSMMRRREPDYFNMPLPVRGSSPTASLAADLSQNMNIDRSSPQYPTPRRSLFHGNSAGSAQFPPMQTPPVPSSSPAPILESMDMSPLPHKPVRSVYTFELQSPTPESTPTEPVFPDCPTPRASSPIEFSDMKLQLPQERRRSNPLRPSLSRTKGWSTNCVPQRPNPEAQLPSFTFGSGIPRSNPASSLALSEIFEASSPVSDKTASPIVKPVMPPGRVRPAFNLCVGPKNASPLGQTQHTRKMSNPLVRPRKQFRRSLSMFEHPNDVMNADHQSPQQSLPAIVDVETLQQPNLPHFYSGDQSCDLPRISRETMIEVLDGKYDSFYNQRVVIDCRFEYEYNGGHISGAVNFNDKDHLSSQLFDHEIPKNALLIFHCEYSAHRAPLMAKYVRNKDRTINAECYPNLTYPEVYILDGGYSAFFRDHRSRCFPQNYVEMDAKEHEHACEAGMGKVKQQQRAKLTRAQTFAFGQHSPPVESSPTTTFHVRNTDDVDMDLGMDFTPIAVRPAFNALQGVRGQRMLSY